MSRSLHPTVNSTTSLRYPGQWTWVDESRTRLRLKTTRLAYLGSPAYAPRGRGSEMRVGVGARTPPVAALALQWAYSVLSAAGYAGLVYRDCLARQLDPRAHEWVRAPRPAELWSNTAHAERSHTLGRPREQMGASPCSPYYIAEHYAKLTPWYPSLGVQYAFLGYPVSPSLGVQEVFLVVFRFAVCPRHTTQLSPSLSLPHLEYVCRLGMIVG
jgi:hypothetical protein